MSICFHPVDDDSVELAELSSRRAALFFALTQAACHLYEVPPAIEERDAAYWIHPEAFCLLVEKVFARPINLLCVWAKYASGMYESLKGEYCTFLWAGGHYEELSVEEVQEIIPSRYAYAPNKIEGAKVIGPHWMLR